ncbi:COG3014 family protein [Salinivibrio kushneri]|uniref:COG3014 family protein n=1 Tax=Salinivibrio kushneri TaxID=1908198 RepID=UPI0022B51A66|nr:hypothetical protein [Salinivibrio kushneri]WBA18262.1 hypothetical protein O4598_01860 [Salinivibrio kushneri]
MKVQSKICTTFLIGVFLSGCTSMHRNQTSGFNEAYKKGNYEIAMQSMEFDKGEDGEVDTESQLLEILHQAEMYRLSGNFETANKYYDLAENGMKYLDMESLAEKSGESFMSVMVNDSVMDYEAMMSEAVMVNTYKGLSFLAQGNSDFARVEFNRADDRTRRAIKYFEAKIAEQKEELSESAKEAESNGDEQASDADKAYFTQQSLQSEALQSTVAENYGGSSQWSAYPEFMVPTSTYIHGLFFLANGESGSDYSKARTSLKRVSEMLPESEQLARDAELAERVASGSVSVDELEPQVWVVFENGLGPALKEKRFDIPLILLHGSQGAPAYTGIALPEYQKRAAIGGNLIVTSEDNPQGVTTEQIGSMGRVFQTEMQARFPAILTRAVSSAVVKALIQNAASEEFGIIGQLGSAALTAVTTKADLRGWQALPDHWQSVRLDRPQDGQLELSHTDGTPIGSISVPEQPFTLVYVKRPTEQAQATVMTIDLQGKQQGDVAHIPKALESIDIAVSQ